MKTIAILLLLTASISGSAKPRSKGISPALMAKAKAGNARAEFFVGFDYERGEGVLQSYAQAASWYRKSAVQGDMLAQSSLGDLYRDGNGVPQDYVQAAIWWSQSARQGDAFAQFDLGRAYEEGQGVPQDFSEAAVWFREAAEEDLPFAQHHLARLLLNGQGVPQDLKQAMSWLRKAADQGDSDSQRTLASVYEDGGAGTIIHESDGSARLKAPEGNNAIPKDFSSAVFWYRKAAEQGDSDAQSHLGQLYKDGIGVPQDYSEAYFWASLAAATGSSSLSQYLIADRDRIAAYLTRTDLSRVQERTTKWFATHQLSSR